MIVTSGGQWWSESIAVIREVCKSLDGCHCHWEGMIVMIVSLSLWHY